MIGLKQYEVWFVTGSLCLYGPAALEKVSANAREVAAALGLASAIPAEIYRVLIEATAFGALAIINRFEEYGVKICQVVNCGGIAEKGPRAYYG
jgi:L-arabinose isomerase